MFRNKGNLNNHIGLPLSLLELRTRPDVAVVELGMNHAGEIRTLVGIAEPDVRVWTNVGDAHLGFFASADAIADAKAEILDRRGPATLLVANADDPRIVSRIARVRRPDRDFRLSARRRCARQSPCSIAGSTACARGRRRPPATRATVDAAARDAATC